MKELERVRTALSGLVAAEESAAKSWYKTGDPDIQVLTDSASTPALPLSKYSSVVRNLAKNNQIKLFAKPEHVAKTKNIVETVRQQ